MITLLSLVVLISALILAHEWGHFYSARKLGVRVEEFGIGFPPRLYSRVKNGVRYSFNLLPLGGFVKIFGEHGEGSGDKTSFASRSATHRFIILSAGVLMNLFTAWVLFTGGALLGVPTVADGDPDIRVSVIAVMPDSPAEKAGIRFGDMILEMRATIEASLRIENEEDIRTFAEAYRGEEITIVVKRGGEIQEITVTPRVMSPDGEGPLGIGLGRLHVKTSPWYRAPLDGFLMTMRTVAVTVEGIGFLLKDIFWNGKTSVPVTGPVGIFFFAEDSRTLGIAYFLQFIGMLSVNLAVLNFLPIPALDGGRVAFLFIEKIRGRPISQRIENTAHTIGFALLIILMIAITYKDIARAF